MPGPISPAKHYQIGSDYTMEFLSLRPTLAAEQPTGLFGNSLDMESFDELPVETDEAHHTAGGDRCTGSPHAIEPGGKLLRRVVSPHGRQPCGGWDHLTGQPPELSDLLHADCPSDAPLPSRLPARI